MLTVKKLAQLAGISVRTLHHYHHMGLLVPSGSSDSGYRLYSPHDVQRLQQILLFKHMGFALKDILALLEHPHYDPKEALQAQAQSLKLQMARLDKLLANVEKTLSQLQQGTMSAQERLEGFDMSEVDRQLREHQEKYAKEAKERWGETNAYQESARRSKNYSKADYARIMQEAGQVSEQMAELLRSGVAYSDAKMQALVQTHRDGISNNFYNCTLQIYAGLAEMYVQDERFKANYDQVEVGLAEYLSNAMKHYIAREQ